MIKDPLILDETTKKNLAIISKSLAKRTSFKYSFAMSILTGVGAAIGATIIFGLVISMTSQVISNSEGRPLLSKIIEVFNLQTVVDTYKNQVPTPTPQ
jgi:hypothetical protein